MWCFWLLVEFGFDLLCCILCGLLGWWVDDLFFDVLFFLFVFCDKIELFDCRIDVLIFEVEWILLWIDDGWKGLVFEVGCLGVVELCGLNCFLVRWFLGIKDEELNFEIMDVMEFEWMCGELFVDFWDICLNFDISIEMGLLDCDLVGLDGLFFWFLCFCIGLFVIDFRVVEFDFLCLFSKLDGFGGWFGKEFVDVCVWGLLWGDMFILFLV